MKQTHRQRLSKNYGTSMKSAQRHNGDPRKRTKIGIEKMFAAMMTENSLGHVGHQCTSAGSAENTKQDKCPTHCTSDVRLKLHSIRDEERNHEKVVKPTLSIRANLRTVSTSPQKPCKQEETEMKCFTLRGKNSSTWNSISCKIIL